MARLPVERTAKGAVDPCLRTGAASPRTGASVGAGGLDVPAAAETVSGDSAMTARERMLEGTTRRGELGRRRACWEGSQAP